MDISEYYEPFYRKYALLICYRGGTAFTTAYLWEKYNPVGTVFFAGTTDELAEFQAMLFTLDMSLQIDRLTAKTPTLDRINQGPVYTIVPSDFITPDMAQALEVSRRGHTSANDDAQFVKALTNYLLVVYSKELPESEKPDLDKVIKDYITSSLNNQHAWRNSNG